MKSETAKALRDAGYLSTTQNFCRSCGDVYQVFSKKSDLVKVEDCACGSKLEVITFEVVK